MRRSGGHPIAYARMIFCSTTLPSLSSHREPGGQGSAAWLPSAVHDGPLWHACRVQIGVWMDGWQMECCGTPFRRGSEVAWQLRPATNLAWLDTVLPPGVAATIDAIEDHHGDPDTPPTPATVVSIATVHCRFAPEPVAGSGLMTRVDAAERWSGDVGDRRFAGFLVRVNTAETA